MSKTLINYDLVVQELSKGLVGKEDDIALCMNLLPHLALAEFRTIRYGSGRQRGVTAHAVKTAATNKGKTLYFVHSAPLRDELIQRLEAAGIREGVTVVVGYLPENWQGETYDTVIIDETGFFFNKFSFDKIYRSLVPVVSDDVVIHLIN